MKLLKSFIIAVVLFSSIKFLKSEQCPHEISLAQPQKELWLTVLVHGIINIKPHLSVSNLIRFLRDQITDSVYARAVELIRNDPFYYQYSAMQTLGLQKIDPLCTNPGYASGAFASAYDFFDQLNTLNPSIKNIYYTFGWSGLLSSQIRYPEALNFYKALQEEVLKYKEQGFDVKVRVIGYSHGGYIALNLGAVYNNFKKHDNAITINELMLIGVPVISDTDHLINSLIFEKVYHFYSPADRVMVVDCLATNRFFSHRVFYPRIGFALPEKLTQVQLRFKRIARTKRASNHTHCKKPYPARHLRNADPGHTELWSFGWTTSYRKYLPYYPFPAGAYLNYIVNTLKRNNITDKHIIVDSYPFNEIMKISNLYYQNMITTPFVKQTEHSLIAESIQAFIPEICSREIYHNKAQEALTQAHEQKKYEWAQRKIDKKNKRTRIEC